MRSVSITFVALLCGLATARGDDRLAEPERRAVDFLAREAAAWPAENECFSCHNNGDGARAVYAAVKLGYESPRARLRDTTDWLSRPGDWRRTETPAEFRDDRLSAIQFSAALVSAVDAACIKDPRALAAAAPVGPPQPNAPGTGHGDE